MKELSPDEIKLVEDYREKKKERERGQIVFEKSIELAAIWVKNHPFEPITCSGFSSEFDIDDKHILLSIIEIISAAKRVSVNINNSSIIPE